MSKDRPARPVGVLGNSFSTPLKGLLIFQIFPLIIAFVGRSPILFYFSTNDFFCCGSDSYFGHRRQVGTSLMAVILFLGGIQLLTIGILGKYISKIYLETKKDHFILSKKKVIFLILQKK